MSAFNETCGRVRLCFRQYKSRDITETLVVIKLVIINKSFKLLLRSQDKP